MNRWLLGVVFILLLPFQSVQAEIYGVAKQGCYFLENWIETWGDTEFGYVREDEWHHFTKSGMYDTGRSGIYIAGNAMLSLDEFNDKMTTVHVGHGCRAKLYRHYDLSDTITFGPGFHALSDYGWNDEASQVACSCREMSTDDALHFDGSHYVRANINNDREMSYFSVPEFTIEAWVFLNSYGHWPRLIDFSNGPAQDNVLFAVSNANSGKPHFGIFNGGSVTGIDSNQQLSLKKWTHVAVTFKGNQGIMYINGIQVAGDNLALTNW